MPNMPDARDDPQAGNRLAVGAHKTVPVHAALWWNDAALAVAPGEMYALEADGEWIDAGIRSTAAGYSLPLLALFTWARRVRDANWFSLIAAVHSASGLAAIEPSAGNFVTGWIESWRRHVRSHDLASQLTDIGARQDLRIRQAGHLYLFANDAYFAYCNNEGTISLRIRRLK
ncbi:hypothetical protein [Massilia putida]|uniref:hypothetical protein n=1 Tax=Massilia putida TaxID=1141883 RepID=UPI0012EBDD80|nr:hypothetical protein [Massilia putida]